MIAFYIHDIHPGRCFRVWASPKNRQKEKQGHWQLDELSRHITSVQLMVLETSGVATGPVNPARGGGIHGGRHFDDLLNELAN